MAILYGILWVLKSSIKLSCRVTTKSSLQSDHPPWQDFTVCHLGPDNGLLVTHTNKAQDLVGKFSC